MRKISTVTGIKNSFHLNAAFKFCYFEAFYVTFHISTIVSRENQNANLGMRNSICIN